MKNGMLSRRARRLLPIGVFSLILFPKIAGADETAALPGDGFAASRYEVLWTKSPFAVASPEGAAPESPDYSLVGIAKFDGISYASIIEKKDHKHFLLSSDKETEGLKLMSITSGHDADHTTALLQANGVPLTLKLDTSAVASSSIIAGTTAPGMPPAPQSLPASFTADQEPPPVIFRARTIRMPTRTQPGGNSPFNGAPPASPPQ